MGLTESLRHKRVYLDSNIFIYVMEGYPPYEGKLRELLHAIANATTRAYSSELAIAEVLVKPIASGTPDERSKYERLFASTSLHMLPITKSVLRQAAKIRAEHTGIKLPDAIHLATAVTASCEVFLTNDSSLRTQQIVPIVLLSQL